MAETEMWKNTTKGTVAVNKLDHRGERYQQLVRGGRSINLTVEERRMNVEMAYDENVDPFRNGTMVPVKIIENDEEIMALQSSPNVKTDDELSELFDLHWKKFDEEIAKITNPATLGRLYELAVEHDATHRQVSSVQARLQEVDPAANVEEVTVQTFGKTRETEGSFRPGTPV